MQWPGVGLLASVVAGLTYVLQRRIRRKYRLRGRGVRTRGTVTGLAESRNDEGAVYCLLVQFTTRQGRQYTGRGQWHGTRPTRAPGSSVAIVYAADNPPDFLLESEASLTGDYLALTLLWLGAAFLVWWASGL